MTPTPQEAREAVSHIEDAEIRGVALDYITASEREIEHLRGLHHQATENYTALLMVQSKLADLQAQLAARDALLAEAKEVLGVLDDLKRYPSYMYEDSDGAYDTVLRVGDLRKAASILQKIREVK